MVKGVTHLPILRRFLDNGSSLETTVTLFRRTAIIKFVKPADFVADSIPAGTFGRIHSQKNGVYSVWLLDEGTMTTVVIEVPLHLMGQYFKQSSHNIFPHLGVY